MNYSPKERPAFVSLLYTFIWVYVSTLSLQVSVSVGDIPTLDFTAIKSAFPNVTRTNTVSTECQMICVYAQYICVLHN